MFPDDCRLCDQPLLNVSRIPVCKACLSLPQPLQAEFFCQTCRTPFLSPYPLDHDGQCATCRENAVNFDFAYSFGSYEGPLRKLVQLFKYGKVETLAGPLSALLLRAVPRDQNFDAIVAMPMHWRKQWERGFNQAELLAQPVARRYGLKLATQPAPEALYAIPGQSERGRTAAESKGLLCSCAAGRNRRQAGVAHRRRLHYRRDLASSHCGAQVRGSCWSLSAYSCESRRPCARRDEFGYGFFFDRIGPSGTCVD